MDRLYEANIMNYSIGIVTFKNRFDNYFKKLLIEIKKQKREFVTHTGIYKGKRISVLSTGIGTDNIDIVYNELDALVNIDLKTRTIKERLTSLKLIRIGTSGALQEDIPVDSFVCSTHGLGLDGLLNFYQLENEGDEKKLIEAFMFTTVICIRNFVHDIALLYGIFVKFDF
jgi:uridine phosphorylase